MPVIGQYFTLAGEYLFGGYFRFIFSPILLVFGAMILLRKTEWNALKGFGILGFFVSVTSLLGWFSRENSPKMFFNIYDPLQNMVGPAMAFIFLLAILLVSLYLIFQLSYAKILKNVGHHTKNAISNMRIPQEDFPEIVEIYEKKKPRKSANRVEEINSELENIRQEKEKTRDDEPTMGATLLSGIFKNPRENMDDEPENLKISEKKKSLRATIIPDKKIPLTDTSGKVISKEKENPAPKIAKPLSGWKLPSTQLLDRPKKANPISPEEIREKALIIQKTLLQFGIEVEMEKECVGPTVIQYRLRPAGGVKVSKIENLNKDLALALSAKSIRIQAPIPGMSLVGIEVPNDKRDVITIREVLESPEFQNNPKKLAVALGKDINGDYVVGDLAKRKAILEPKNVIYEVKRWIGRKYSEVKDELKNMTYDTKEGSDGGVLIVVDGKEYKPEQISAFILQKLKTDAEKFLGETITQAVITVPAYFNDSQRNATKAAGEIAGLKVERIINEPTAAALAYGEGKKSDEKIVVFDLGGGTFDVTVLEIGAEGTFQVLSTSGDTQLGGADWDQRIINYIVDAFKTKEGIDLRDNSMAMQRVKDEAEKAKKQLSSVERVDISIPFITTGADGLPRNLDETLTRAQFENITSDLFSRCKEPVLNALNDSKLNKSEINDIILVGGSTRMLKVKEIVKDIFGKEPKSTVNPDESVAQGAAIQ